MIDIESMTYAYNRRKEALIQEGVPFLSYLHFNPMRETGGYQFIKLIEVQEKPVRGQGKGKSNGLSKRGRKHFDRIVRQLEKAGTLIDMTEYTPEVGEPHASKQSASI